MDIQQIQSTIGKREIKFRAWDLDAKEMVKLRTLVFDTLPKAVSCYSDIDGTCNRDAPIRNFELMQFTGLRDAKGVEIYEGDILRFREDIDDATNRKGIAAVWYEDGAFRYGSHIAGKFMQHAVVVGNVFENPDLLSSLTFALPPRSSRRYGSDWKRC